MALQALVSQHLGTLRTQEGSHALQSDKMKSAHEDERKRVALEHVAARRSEDAQLRAEMQEDYDCKLVCERRKGFKAVQGDPLHAVHQVPSWVSTHVTVQQNGSLKQPAGFKFRCASASCCAAQN